MVGLNGSLESMSIYLYHSAIVITVLYVVEMQRRTVSPCPFQPARVITVSTKVLAYAKPTL
jgi:hypothetical protein